MDNMASRQVSWLAGRCGVRPSRCSSHQWPTRTLLAADSCGGSAGFLSCDSSPASLLATRFCNLADHDAYMWCYSYCTVKRVKISAVNCCGDRGHDVGRQAWLLPNLTTGIAPMTLRLSQMGNTPVAPAPSSAIVAPVVVLQTQLVWSQEGSRCDEIESVRSNQSRRCPRNCKR